MPYGFINEFISILLIVVHWNKAFFARSRWMRIEFVHVELQGFVIPVSYQWGRPCRRLAQPTIDTDIVIYQA